MAYQILALGVAAALTASAAAADCNGASNPCRLTDGCATPEPDSTETTGIYTIQHWTNCTSGARLDFALHGGSHGILKGWAKMAVDWFEAN
jgi:polyhydroxybutyrate depolymerase